jgi:hypothetical protein
MCNDIDTEVGICTLLRMRSWNGYGIVVLLLLTYVGSYGYFSRRGLAMADGWGFAGFNFYLPGETREWRCRETTLPILYLPLIYVDC